MVSKLLVAYIKNDLGEKELKEDCQNSLDKIKIILEVKIEYLISYLFQKNVENLEMTGIEKKKLLKYIELPRFKKSFLTIQEKEIIKLFVEKLKEYDDINADIVKEIIDSMANSLYFEAINEENKDLNFLEIQFVEELKQELKESDDDIKNIILDKLKLDIKIDLECEYNFKIDDIFELLMSEYEQLQEILKREDIKEHYILDCLSKKVKDFKHLDKHILEIATNEMIKDLFCKIYEVTEKQKELYQSFVNDILKSYKKIDNNTIEQIKENINVFLDLKKLSL